MAKNFRRNNWWRCRLSRNKLSETPAQLNKKKKQESRVEVQKKIMITAERNSPTNKLKLIHNKKNTPTNSTIQAPIFKLDPNSNIKRSKDLYQNTNIYQLTTSTNETTSTYAPISTKTPIQRLLNQPI